jgi:thiol:disulfide interchange protein
MINRKKIFSLLLLATLALQIPLSKAQDQELLPPEEAFNLTAWIDGDELVAEYKIAAGYYMYRKRFDFTVETSDAPVRFDQAQIPAGKLNQDEFFGETETYREQVTIRLPILFDATPASRLEVKATSQGCADIGVCYPPLKQLLTVNLASSAHITPTAWSKQAASADTAGADVAALQSLLLEVTSPDSQQQSSKPSSSSTGNGDNALAVLQSSKPSKNTAGALPSCDSRACSGSQPASRPCSHLPAVPSTKHSGA